MGHVHGEAERLTWTEGWSMSCGWWDILDVWMFPELVYTSVQCGLSTQLPCRHLQVGTSRQVPSTLSWGLIWNSKRVGTMAEMLCVGEITLRERPEEGNKRESRVESWKRKDKIPLRSGERRKRYYHRCEFSRRGLRLPWSLAGHFGRSWQVELADSVALALKGGEEIPAPVPLRKAPFEYSRPYIPGIYWRACENKGGKLTLDVEKFRIYILCLNKITLINHRLGNLTDPDGCDLSNCINLFNVTATLRGPPGSALAQGQQPGWWPQPQPWGQGKTAPK